MRHSLGLVLSVALHVGVACLAVFGTGTQEPRVDMDRPVTMVDLISLAPPPPAPTPPQVVEVQPEAATAPTVPVVEAAPEPAVEVKAPPVVEAEPEAAKPKVEEISPKKVEKKTVIKKEEPEAKPNPKPEPKPLPAPKPQKTTQELLAEGLAAAKAETKKQEAQKAQALQDELAAIKQREGDTVYAHGGQPGGVEGGREGGAIGGSGSGLSEVYALIVGSAIKKNWRYPTFAGEQNLVATVEIQLESSGRIISAKVVESSGNAELDSSTLRAIRETEVVEKPRTERDKTLLINFNSQELSE